MTSCTDPREVPVRELANGAAIPAIGLGTFGNDRFSASDVAHAVDGAVRTGYRFIDCAAAYGNEAEIGNVIRGLIRNRIVARDELFLSSKVWNTHHGRGDTIRACEMSLRDLKIDYLDLYLVHWPFPNHHPPGAAPDSRQPDSRPFSIDEYMMCWRQMEELVRRGLVRGIGTSNMTIAKMDALLPLCEVAPVANQMEVHPAFQQPELLRYCVDRRIQPIAFSPLGSPVRPARDRTPGDISPMEMPEIRGIAEARGIHPALVCLKWAAQRGQIPIPFSVSSDEIVANLRAVTEDPLSAEEMRTIEEADRGCRLIKGVVFLWQSASSWRDLWDEARDADS